MHVILLTYAYYYLKLLERYTTVNAVTTRMIWQHRMWFSAISNSGGLFGYLLFRWPISCCWFAFCRGSWMRVWARRHKFSAMDTTSLGSIDLAVTQHRCACVCVCVCVWACVASAPSIYTNIQPCVRTYIRIWISVSNKLPGWDVHDFMRQWFRHREAAAEALRRSRNFFYFVLLNFCLFLPFSPSFLLFLSSSYAKPMGLSSVTWSKSYELLTY